MRFLRQGLFAALCILTSSWALQESEVGVVDWHKNLIGIPLFESPSTAPVFHRVGKETTQSVILTATESNVLAALNPVNGSIGTRFSLARARCNSSRNPCKPAWRHIFEPQDTIVQFRKHKNGE